ncbi:MAG: alpha/beta hydrolase [Acidimicrobiales bacterium]
MIGSSSRTVRTPDGVDIAVRDFGGSGESVLFAHATGFCGALFGPLIEQLPSHYRGVAIDLRGHGDSAPPPDLNFDWQGFATDILTVIDALALDHPFVVGHSCGATSAFLAEQRRPGTFRGMYCYEPAMGFGGRRDVPVPNVMSEGARRRRASFASHDQLVAYLQSKALFAGFDPAVLDAYVQHGFAQHDDGSWRLKCLPEYEARTFENGGSNDAVERLVEVTCPVALVYGDAADSFAPEMAQLVLAGLPNADLHVAHGLGHLGPFEKPAQIADDITARFESV